MRMHRNCRCRLVPLDSGCTKRCYPSASAAKLAHTRAHFRVRVYRCEQCLAWHVANAEKERTGWNHGNRS